MAIWGGEGPPPDLEIKVGRFGKKVGRFGKKSAGLGKSWQVCENSWHVGKKVGRLGKKLAGREKFERLRALKFKVRKYLKVVRLRKLVCGNLPRKCSLG